MQDSLSTCKQKEESSVFAALFLLFGIRSSYIGGLRGRGACCLCDLTYVSIWGFDLLNSAQHEEEAEYANDENSTRDQEIGGKASTISHETCDDRGNNAGHVTQKVHNTTDRPDSSCRRNE